MEAFTAIDVKTIPNIERIKEYADENELSVEEALAKKEMGEGYFPIRDQKIVAIGAFTYFTEGDKGKVNRISLAGDEKKILEETAKYIADIMKITKSMPYFVTADGRKYALEILASRALTHMIEAKKKDEEISPEMAKMLKVLASPKNGYLKPFDTKDSLDLQAYIGLGTDKNALKCQKLYKEKDFEALAFEAAKTVLDIAQNYAALMEIQSGDMKKGVYTLKADGCKSKIFPIEEKEEEVEEIIEEDIAEPEEPDDVDR